LKLERNRVSFWDRDLPDAFLVGLVVVRVVGTGQDSGLLTDLAATHRYNTVHQTMSNDYSRILKQK